MSLSASTVSDSSATHKSDLELATEIGRGLLSEINRMRVLLQEKGDSIHTLETQKWENEQKIHELYGQLAHKSEIEERYKEDMSNLDITKQNLTYQISQLKTTIRKLQSEQLVHQNKEVLMQRELEALKAAQKNLQTMTIRTQIKHETTIFELNRTIERLRNERQETMNRLHDSDGVDTSSDRFQQVPRSDMTSFDEVQGIVNEGGEEPAHGSPNELDSLLREAQETIENVQQSNQNLSSATSAYDKHACSEIDEESNYTCSNNEPEQVQEKRTEEDITEQDIQKYLPVLSHTMTGEELKKYVRHPVKARFSNLHSRYFWLHPYTKTLYWSENKPEHGEYKLKSMSIQSFSIIQSAHKIPIIRIHSFNNQMEIQCNNQESFQKWTQSLECLFMKPVFNKTMNRLSQLSN